MKYSPEEAWNSFKDVYFQGNEEAAASFGEDNPLVNSSSYSIYMNDVSMQDTLVTYLTSIDGVREVKKSEQIANTLADLNRLIGYISAGSLILLGVAVFFNWKTITVGICRAQGGDRHYEADRSDRLFCTGAVCG